MRKHIRPQDQNRFVFVQMDMADMTPALLERIMQAEWGVGVDKLSHFHDSHPCTTLSRAERNGIHRYPDGSPKSDDAIRDDWVLAQTVKFVRGVLERAPDCLVTIENPVGPWFPVLAPVRELLDTPGWELLVGSYCKCASHLDGERHWPQKHTFILAHGVRPGFELPVCRLDCEHLLPGTRRHRIVLCTNRDNHPRQVVLSDAMVKGIIPLGLFDLVWKEHLALLEGKSLQKRAKRTATDKNPQAQVATRSKSKLGDGEILVGDKEKGGMHECKPAGTQEKGGIHMPAETEEVEGDSDSSEDDADASAPAEDEEDYAEDGTAVFGRYNPCVRETGAATFRCGCTTSTPPFAISTPNTNRRRAMSTHGRARTRAWRKTSPGTIC